MYQCNAVTFAGHTHYSCILCKIHFLSALRKNNDNLRGTGGGSGEEFSLPEQRALDCMKSRGSDLITGIEGGFETSFGNSSSVSVIC